ncbi:hypothetical protein KI387_014405, partial [Taxus chinensis]
GDCNFSWRISPAQCRTPRPLKHKRSLLIFVSTTLGGSLLPLNFLHAEEEKEKPSAEDNNNEEGLVGGLLSLFVPNEKTKSGRVLPKSYVKSAREVVKSLRESLKGRCQGKRQVQKNGGFCKRSDQGFRAELDGPEIRRAG